MYILSDGFGSGDGWAATANGRTLHDIMVIALCTILQRRFTLQTMRKVIVYIVAIGVGLYFSLWASTVMLGMTHLEVLKELFG